MLQAAARIAAGQMPYRDFRINYPPGQAVVLAAFHRAIGPRLITWRVLRMAVDGTTTVLAYRLTRRRAGEALALGAGAAVAGAMAFPTGPGPNPAAQALAFAALLSAERSPYRAGALAGLTACFRLEVGAAAVVGAALAAPRGGRLRALGAAAVVGAGALAPFAAAAPRDMFDDTIGFFAVQRLQRLPFPLRFRGPWRPSKMIEFYTPAVLLASLTTCALALATARRDAGASDLALSPLAIVGAGYLLARTDEFHLVTLAATMPVMLADIAASERRAPVRRLLVGWLALILAHGLDRKVGQCLHPPALSPVPGVVGRWVYTSPHDARSLEGLIRTVHRVTVPGEPIFVANARHDLIRVGDPLLYVLLERPNPTRYDVMQPGIVTTETVQAEIVAGLAHTRVVVRWLHPTACEPEPNGAGRSSGVTLLDRYLASHFREHARFGDYAVLLRTVDSV